MLGMGRPRSHAAHPPRLAPNRQPRIVALTAAAFSEDRARCLEADMDDYVSKPVDFDGLSRALSRARLAQGGSSGSASRAEGSLVPASATAG